MPHGALHVCQKPLDMSKALDTLRAKFTERSSFRGRAAIITMMAQIESAIGIKGGMQLLLSAVLGLGLPAPAFFQAQPTDRLEPPDWFAGDAHVHRGIGCGRSNEKEMLTPKQILEGMQTNNLAVISVLAEIGNGEIKYADRDIPMITGEDNAVANGQRLVHLDDERHLDPEDVTFSDKVSVGHRFVRGITRG